MSHSAFNSSITIQDISKFFQDESEFYEGFRIWGIHSSIFHCTAHLWLGIQICSPFQQGLCAFCVPITGCMVESCPIILQIHMSAQNKITRLPEMINVFIAFLYIWRCRQQQQLLSTFSCAPILCNKFSRGVVWILFYDIAMLISILICQSSLKQIVSDWANARSPHSNIVAFTGINMPTTRSNMLDHHMKCLTLNHAIVVRFGFWIKVSCT